jgi:hypothetical protein
MLCVVFLIADDAFAQCEIQSIGHLGSVDLGYMPDDVAVSGSHAYLISRDTGFTVVDVSDPTAPQIVASIEMPLWSPNLVVDGSYAYVSSGDFMIIDVSDPTAPSIVSSISFFPDPAEDVAVSGSYAYVACYYAGLKIVDISDPSSPQEVGSVETGSIASNVDISGSYAYVAHWGQDMVIVDVSDPHAPAIAGRLDTESGFWNIAVSGPYAYMATSQGSGSMHVIDVSDPSSPHIVGILDIRGSPGNIVVSGTYAYAIGSGITVIDISDPTSAHAINFFFPGAYIFAVGMAIEGDSAYVAYREAESYEAGGLKVLDISYLSQLPIVETLNEPDYGESNDIAVLGLFAYATGSSGLQVLDISSPASPVRVGLLETPQSGHFAGVAVSGSNTFVADYHLGLHIVDTSDPSAPSIVTSVDTPGTPQAVVVSGSYAYVADGGSGLQVIDASDPASAHIEGSVDLPGSAYDVAIAGSYACIVTEFPAGLHVVDVSDAAAPELVGSNSSITYAKGVAASGSYVYVVDVLDGLKVVNIAEPTAPTIIGSCEASGTDVSLSGSYAYVIDDYRPLISLFAVDISDPDSPLIVAAVSLPDVGWIHAVAVSGSYAYLDGSDYYGDKLHVVGLCPESGGTPAIALGTTSLSASNDQGADPPDQQFELWNSGDGTLSYMISTDAWWLEIDPFMGGSLGEHDMIEVSFNTSELPAGEHTGKIVVADPTAVNNLQYIDVAVTVYPTYRNLTTVSSPPQAGTVTGGGTYGYGERVEIEALPNVGWEFDRWQSSDSNVDGSEVNPRSIRMNADKSVTAVFKRIYHDLTVYSYPAEVSTASGTGTYEYGTNVVVSAYSGYGWRFSHWEGDDIGGSTNHPEQITMDADKMVIAIFEVVPLTHISLMRPTNGSVRYTTPWFGWTSGAGTDTVFSVDVSLNFLGPYYSTWEHLGIPLEEENWIMPPNIWNKIPSGSYVFWRVRGMDRDAQPPTIVYSNEVWFFYKP